MTNVKIKTQQESFVLNSKEESIRDSMKEIADNIVEVLEEDDKDCISYIIGISVIKINTIVS